MPAFAVNDAPCTDIDMQITITPRNNTDNSTPDHIHISLAESDSIGMNETAQNRDREREKETGGEVQVQSSSSQDCNHQAKCVKTERDLSIAMPHSQQPLPLQKSLEKEMDQTDKPSTNSNSSTSTEDGEPTEPAVTETPASPPQPHSPSYAMRLVRKMHSTGTIERRNSNTVDYRRSVSPTPSTMSSHSSSDIDEAHKQMLMFDSTHDPNLGCKNHIIATDLNTITHFSSSESSGRRKAYTISKSHSALIDSHTAYRRDLDKIITDLKLQLAQTQEMADLSQSELKMAKRQLEKRNIEVEDLTKRCDEAKRMVDDLSMVVTHLQCNASESALERATLHTKTIEQEQEHKRLLSRTKQMKNENKRLKLSLKEVGKELEGKSMEIQGLKSENEYMKRQQRLNQQNRNELDIEYDDSSDSENENDAHPPVITGLRNFLTPSRRRHKRRKRPSKSETTNRRASMSTITGPSEDDRDTTQLPTRRIDIPHEGIDHHQGGGSYKSFAEIMMDESSIATDDCEQVNMGNGGKVPFSSNRTHEKYRRRRSSSNKTKNMLNTDTLRSHHFERDGKDEIPYSSEDILRMNAEVGDMIVNSENSDSDVTPPARIENSAKVDTYGIEPDTKENQQSSFRWNWWWSKDETADTTNDRRRNNCDDDFGSPSSHDVDGISDSDFDTSNSKALLTALTPPTRPSSTLWSTGKSGTLVPRRMDTSPF